MNEKLLQFIWQHLYFNMWDLLTVQQEPVEIMSTGRINRDQGPDFLSGQVNINGQVWAGNIELHVLSSDWELHRHDDDRNYDNVVLHVVWRHDRPIRSPIPILELEPRVPRHLLKKYSGWRDQKQFIPCAGEWSGLNKTMVYPFLDWLMMQRLGERSRHAFDQVKALGMDWEEAFWRSLARGFGHKVNADAFEAIAISLPVKKIMRHSHDRHQLEALLLGQAGLLRTDTGDEYANGLFREFCFLRNKYQLDKQYMPVHFLRMRPGNFPTLRLAQLADLMAKTTNLFRIILGITELDQLKKQLRSTASSYWDHHYRFGETSSCIRKTSGEGFIDLLIMNTVMPFLIAYHIEAGKHEKADRVSAWAYQLKPEANLITGGFERLGIKAAHMGQSQGLLELKQHYCNEYKCLECAIGKHLLKQPAERC